MSTNTTLLKTRAAASVLGVTPPCLLAAVHRGKIPTPGKDSSGDYLWTRADLDAARQAFARDLRRKEHRQAQPA